MAKEALFNILNNRIDFEGIKVLDLFSGTGNISVEFASRGAAEVVSVDRDTGCINYLKDLAKKHKLEEISTFRADVLKFLKEERNTFDLIFADPPYDMPEIPQIAEMVFNQNLLNPNGILIVEHPSSKRIGTHHNFVEQRKYGNSSFSFFELEKPLDGQ